MYRPHRQEDFDAFNDHSGVEDEDGEDERPPNAQDASVKWVRLLLHSSALTHMHRRKSFISMRTPDGEANLLSDLTRPLQSSIFSEHPWGPYLEPSPDSKSVISSGTVTPEMKSETSSASASSALKRNAQKAGLEARREDDQPAAKDASTSSSKRPKVGSSHSCCPPQRLPSIR